VHQLETACNEFDHVEVRAILQRLVIEYKPQCGIEDFIWQTKITSMPPAPVTVAFLR
jgi:hypothetical protein